MTKSRLEAFSDGVLAIIITIMVLEMKVPHGDSIYALKPVLPILLSYILSFINIGIYWNNHHHLFHAVKQINGKVLWANIHLLFWLSLLPFFTGWMGENNFTMWPVALYGINLLLAGVAYYVLSKILIRVHGNNSTLAIALGKDKKGFISILLYGVGVLISLLGFSTIGLIIYAIVAIIWFIPDKRIEKALSDKIG